MKASHIRKRYFVSVITVVTGTAQQSKVELFHLLSQLVIDHRRNELTSEPLFLIGRNFNLFSGC